MAEYDDHEWITMLFAPLWVYEGVTGADLEIDDEELDVLAGELYDAEEAETYANDLTQDVLTDLAEDYEYIVEEFLDDEASTTEGIEDVNELLAEKEDAVTALGFKLDMITLAVRVANAADGGWFGDDLDDDEVEAIKRVTALFDLDEDALNNLLGQLEQIISA